MNAKHTPGPWRSINFGTEVRTEDMRTAVASRGMGYDHEDGDGRRTADARLIAAAPDLLGFARLVADLEAKCRSEGGRHPTYAEWAVLATSIPAIARATGGGA